MGQLCCFKLGISIPNLKTCIPGDRSHPYRGDSIHFCGLSSRAKNRYDISETDFEEDIDESDLPPKMLRLLTMEDKQILPHQEVTELINLGTDDEKKRSQNWLIPRFTRKEGNNRPLQRLCRYFR